MARKSRININETDASKHIALYKAAIYRRLSDDDGEDIETNSLGNQEKIIRAFLVDHPEISVVDVYTDNGYTGMNFNRPDFIRLKKDLESGEINCILVKDVSRLGRNFILTSEYVERYFPNNGIRFICINDNYDSSDENADAASLMMPFKMVMNDAYSRDTSKKIRSSIDALMDGGEFLPSASSIPYGYIRNPGDNTYDIDDEAANIVKLIFEMRAKGMKFNSIAKELNNMGILCPGKLRFERKITKAEKYRNAIWIRGTIRKITNDIVYLGHRVHGRVKRDRIGADKKRRSVDEWKIIKNTHPALISEELFNIVKKVNEEELATRSTYRKRARPGIDYRSIFQDKLFCYECGAKMRAQKGCARHNAKTPSRIYYDCAGYFNSNHDLCSSHYIRQETIMNAVKSLLNSQFKASINVEKLIKDIKNMPKFNLFQSNIDDQIQSATIKKLNLEGKIEQLLIDFTSRLISRDEYDFIKRKYLAKIEEHKAEIESLKAKHKGFDNIIESTNQWLVHIKKYHKLPTITKELFDELVEKIYISKGQVVNIELRYADPYKSIIEYLDNDEVTRNAS